jgi:CARDB/WD40-like Beta Propeller Repeat
MRYKVFSLGAVVGVFLLALGAALAWGGHASADDPTPTPTAGAGPDLVVEDIYDAQQHYPWDCTTPAGVVIVVRNNGSLSAGASTTRISVPSQDGASLATPSLAPGAAATLWSPIIGIPLGETYTAVADWDGVVAETNETNNSLSVYVQLATLPTCEPTPIPTPTPSASATPPPYPPGTTTRVSLSTAGSQGNGDSSGVAISADGRYVVFSSKATNLVAGDTNGYEDIFVHDRQTGETTRVSVDSAGEQGNSYSRDADISADGRYVVFGSRATNLVSGDTNGETDVFVHDRQTAETTRVSTDSAGNQGDGYCGGPAMSADGRYVTFQCDASNLVAGDSNDFCDTDYDTVLDNNCTDTFVHDRQTGETTRVSVDSVGGQGNSYSWDADISADGRYVVLSSRATNLVLGDTNGYEDIFMHDRQTGETTRVSVDSTGNQADNASIRPAISSDGRYVVFWSAATNLVQGDTNVVCGWNPPYNCPDTFVHDRQSGETWRVSVDAFGGQGDGYSDSQDISASGRYVAFSTYASNLVPEDANGISADVLVHDSQTSRKALVSVASDGSQGNDNSGGPLLSADGRYVVFTSRATNLVQGDTNGKWDVFVHDLGDADGDDVSNPFDNCPIAYNPGQANSDVQRRPNGEQVSSEWASNPAIDDLGDACDIDSDNDGLPDAAENDTSCPYRLVGDSDGDTVLDGYETGPEEDPCNAANKPVCGNSPDTDGDGFSDCVEHSGYNTCAFTNDPAPGYSNCSTPTDSDLDGCADWIEIVDVNGNRQAEILDVLFVVKRWLDLIPASDSDVVLDMDKNGSVNLIDALLAAKNSNLVRSHSQCTPEG